MTVEEKSIWFTDTKAVPEIIPVVIEVTIKQVENGYIIKVGCKTFIAKTWNEASTGIEHYFADPKGAEKVYCRERKA